MRNGYQFQIFYTYQLTFLQSLWFIAISQFLYIQDRMISDKKVFLASVLVLSLFSLAYFSMRGQKALSKGYLAEPIPNRIIQFSGYSWYVRIKNAQPQGPGPNYFNDNQSSIWLDHNSHLHLKIYKDLNKWYCSQVFTEKSFGYGSYVYNVEKGFELIDPRSVAGLFNYLDDKHQIDVQLSQWGDPNIPNTQYVVQPYNVAGNILRFSMVNRNISVIHAYTWTSTYVLFQTFYADSITQIQKQIGIISQSERVLKQWKYTGKYNPKPSTEKVHINFWLSEGKPPLNEQNQQIVVKQFKFLPLK